MQRAPSTVWLVVSFTLLFTFGMAASQSQAHDGTPAPGETVPAGAGQAMEPLAIGLFEQVPAPPVVFDLSRATFPPGASTPPGPDPGPSLTYVASGQLRFLLDGPATVTRLATGPQPASADETVEAGNWIVVPAGTGFQAVNSTSEQAVALVLRLTPLAQGSPSAEPSAPLASPAAGALAGTPGPEPVSLIFEPLAGGVLTNLPPAPLAVALTRLTYEPGAGDPMPSQNPGPLIGYVESGQIGYTLASGEAIVGRSGVPGVSGSTAGVEVTLNAGDWLFEQAGTASQGRNPGDTPASILLAILAPPEAFLGLVPAETPVASPAP